MKIPIKTTSEQEIMRVGGKKLALILSELKTRAVPGVAKRELDELAKRLCTKHHVKPSFLGYGGFPAALCVSVNAGVVHGLPDETPLREGDIVSLDMGVLHAGFHTDSAVSFLCTDGSSPKDEAAQKMIKATENAFFSAVDLIKPGVHMGDISERLQQGGEFYGYGVIRMLVGHGIGREVHEEPHIPNYGNKGTGPILKEGMTLAIEPMFTESGEVGVILGEDGWTYFTADGSRATHYEHTVLVTRHGAEVLTLG
jgi:methionyl aminopeptidase